MQRVMRYRLFGPIEAWRGDNRVELGGPKQRAVLAVLLLEAGKVVSTDRLIDAVWGQDPPPSAVGTLQVYISNLRKLLRDDERATSPIVRQAPGYVMKVSNDDIDLGRFAADCASAQSAIDDSDWAVAAGACDRALQLWRSAPMVEIADQDWVQIATTALAELRANCQLHLVESLLGLGRVTAALSAVAGLRNEQPLSERACWLHMIALYRAGRQAEALDVFSHQSEFMADELGLDVGPALRDLQGAILRQDLALSSWPSTTDTRTPGVVEPASPPPAPAPTRAQRASDIVGRSTEIEALRATLQEARIDDSRWAVITGVAGIGKSRLAEEAISLWLQEGGKVCRTQCPDDDVPPWWPIRQLLRDLDIDPDTILVPPAGVDADVARFAVYEKVSTVLAATTAVGPLLFLVDDAHWADRTSLRLLSYLAESHHLPGLAVVMTVRDSAGGPDVERMLAAVARRRGSRRLALPVLNTAEVQTLASRVSGQDLNADDAHQLARQTGGNPFFVSEYARLPPEERRAGEAPLAVRAVLGRRLAGLDPAVLQVLRTAAVIGDTLDIGLLAQVTRLDRDELADLLDEAADEHIIESARGSGSYHFAHALLRDEVTAGMSAIRRQRLHLRIAEAIGPDGGSEQLIRRAAHLMAALPVADAADAFRACMLAAQDAEQRWQSDAAAQWWGNALQAFDSSPTELGFDRGGMVIAQVNALARAGQGQTVLDVVDAALLEALRGHRLDSVGRLAACLLRASGAWPWVAHGADPGPLLARLTGIEPSVRTDPAAHVRVLAALAVGNYYHEDTAVPDALSRRALELADTLDNADVLADALLGRALTFSAVAGRAAEQVVLLDRLAELPHQSAQIDGVLRHTLLTIALLTLGRTDEVAEHIRLGAVGSDLLRLPVTRVQLRWIEGTLAVWAGDLDRAERLYHNAFDIHRQTQLYQSGTYDVAVMCLQWEQGRLAEEPPTGPPDPTALPWARAIAAAARGEADADELLAAELDRAEPVIWTTHGRLTLLAHAVADRRLTALAGPLRDRLLPYAGMLANIGQVGIFGPVALAVARLSLVADDIAGAQQWVEQAADIADRSGSPRNRMRCRLVAAQIRHAAGYSLDPVALEQLSRQAQALGMSREATWPE